MLVGVPACASFNAKNDVLISWLLWIVSAASEEYLGMAWHEKQS